MVSFDINGAIIEFDEKSYNYNIIRKNFKLEAVDIQSKFEIHCLNNILSLSQLSDKGLNIGIESIEDALRKGVETIVSYGIVTIDINTFKESYCKKYLNYERLFRNLDKEILSPNKNKKNNYNNKYSLKSLIKKISKYIYDDCFNIHYAVIDALLENKINDISCYIDEERKKKSNALFNNYKDGFISKPDEPKVVKQIITLNPYRCDIYEYLIKEDGDFTKEIERLTEFLGYDIKDYKDELMNIYIKELIDSHINDLEIAKEKIRKYSKYIGCKEENIYEMRLDAICTFETA